MLYNQNSKQDFTKLRQAFSKAGFSQANTELCIEYMTKDERDDSLLEKVVPQDFTYNSSDYMMRRAIADGVVDNGMRYGDECAKRLFIFLSKLVGIKVNSFIQTGLAYTKGYNIDEAITYTTEILKDCMGEENALAFSYASFMAFTAEDDRQSIPHMKPPEVCIRALDFCEENDFRTRLMLCAYALNGSEPAAQNEYTKKAVASIKDMIENNEKSFDKEAKIYALIAMAESAFFSQEVGLMFVPRCGGAAYFIADRLFDMRCDHTRVLDVIHKVPRSMNADYIFLLGVLLDPDRRRGVYSKALPNNSTIPEKYLVKAAKEKPDLFIMTISKMRDPAVSFELYRLMRKTCPEAESQMPNIKIMMRNRMAETITAMLSTNAEGDVYKYLIGEGSLEAAMKEACKTGKRMKASLAYPMNYVVDEFVKRCFVLMFLNVKLLPSTPCIEQYSGYTVKDNEAKALEIIFAHTDDSTNIAESLGYIIDSYYSKDAMIVNTANAMEKYSDKFAEADISKLGTNAKQLIAISLGKQANRYKKPLLILTDETSKTMKNLLISIIAPCSGWEDEIKAMLKAKKAAKRELALDIIAKQGGEKYSEELNAALESEKSDKLKDKIALILGQQVQDANGVQPKSMDKIIEELTKGSKSKKVDWLFKDELSPVKDTSGNDADEKLLKALTASYACMEKCGVNPIAEEIAKGFDKASLESFAKEVFGKWLDLGAQAKTKWVLYFASIHGGNRIVNDLLHYIKEWGEGSRGAIASEAVRALALNGSPIAFINVDNISRKFKNKQVKGAAAEALSFAAEQLGITTQELQDRIVPDLGFNEDRYREFDYGSRTFRVYISPALELEIMNGDKKIKTMPKPGANDDAEKANAAYEDFKELKKQLKTVVTNQKQRLEYVMMCDRKWSVESWEKLFVKNPVMHSFAIGLIWGTYEEGKLLTSFRYMEDGSFTTSDEDEFELPENAQIGLVHPIELSKEECETWLEQLSDYEIVQPFKQLSRQVFTASDTERSLDELDRFKGKTMNSLSLISKMTKLGWYKGQPEDAGFFYYFIRNDLTSRKRNDDGSSTVEGKGVMLKISGASVVNYDFEGEEVTIEEMIFFDPKHEPSYWDKEHKGYMLIGDVDKRYFSEIVMQLTALFGTENDVTEE